jgi:hypothetical protein
LNTKIEVHRARGRWLVALVGAVIAMPLFGASAALAQSETFTGPFEYVVPDGVTYLNVDLVGGGGGGGGAAGGGGGGGGMGAVTSTQGWLTSAEAAKLIRLIGRL